MSTSPEPLGLDVHRLVFDLASRGPTLAREAGMHPTDLRALVLVLEADRAGEAVGPAALARQLGLTTAAVTSVVDRLVGLGLVRRQQSAQDRRRVEIRLTEEAATSTLSGLGQLVAAIAHRVDGYPAGDKAAVARFLRDVLAITSEAAEAR